MLFVTETWLTHTQTSPNILNYQVVARSDRVHENHNGGVMITINNSVKASNVLNFHSNTFIEATTVTLSLPSKKQVQITVIYRSPCVTMTALLPALSSIIDSLSMTIPSIILGDFNDDLITKTDMRLQNFMSSHEYSQLVHEPTTDNGSLIDHVYSNIPSECQDVCVVDAYYSDHDIVCFSLP